MKFLAVILTSFMGYWGLKYDFVNDETLKPRIFIAKFKILRS